MQPARDGLSKILAGIEFKDPEVPIVANTTAMPLTEAVELRPELEKQLNNAVQWQRSIEYMVNQGVTTFYEIGPGRVLAGLNKRINRDIETINISGVEAIDKLSA